VREALNAQERRRGRDWPGQIVRCQTEREPLQSRQPGQPFGVFTGVGLRACMLAMMDPGLQPAYRRPGRRKVDVR
jgi:hypothetical protein